MSEFPSPAVHVTGEGPAILFLHAFPLDSSQWDHQVGALSGKHRCIRPDFWGCGASQPLPDPTTASFSAFAAAVLQHLDSISVDKFAVVGSSMGGYAAFEFLRQAPSRVSAVGLLSTRAGADSGQQSADRTQIAERALTDGVEFLVEMMTDRLLGAAAQREVHISDPVRGRIRRCTPTGIAASEYAMSGRTDSRELLRQITVPAMVVAGEDDVIIPVAESQQMASSIPNAQLQIISGLGHLPNLEDHVAVSNLIASLV